MRHGWIPGLLFASYLGNAQMGLTAQLRNSQLGASMLRIEQARLEPPVVICVVNDPDHVLLEKAELLADRMFARIRVKLWWHGPPACVPGAEVPIFLTIQVRTADDLAPGALGMAWPLEGSHATVFYDRVRRVPDGLQPALMAHVMVHEITHLLQGSIRHSETGIMKAHWSNAECARMPELPLRFTAEDVMLIRRGLEQRRSRMPSNGSMQISARGEILPMAP